MAGGRGPSLNDSVKTVGGSEMPEETDAGAPAGEGVDGAAMVVGAEVNAADDLRAAFNVMVGV